MKQLTCGSLFAGIGGFDLGFERAGIKTIWQVEIDEYCRRVLARHFPDAERHTNVRSVGKHTLQWVNILAGGFPCQDVSNANPAGDALAGKRSGLVWEYIRIIRELGPDYAVMENVSGLLDRGLGEVLGALADIGYDAEWQCLPASFFGAPHERQRVWVVAYPHSSRVRIFGDVDWLQEIKTPQLWQSFRTTDLHSWLKTYCGLSGDVNGLSGRVDEAGALGNAIVPQIAEWLGQRILSAEEKITEKP